ncbi:F-box/LRR-repeat protein At3g58900 isoform X3 [Sesamum indicum]|nr:F-box/LRR-repeat protein At3g58900 isoform X2 [Sesamum indicum]XP_011095357.1 F-box/LRR-repeat protein At3g58900 isoform X2 [Sesamum indicum]XP_011095358.1 F-box/LRR-repeat protein At3g58900 isoform X3 [Sesamum indicum]
MGSFKVMKVSTEQIIDDGYDKISLLPDCILHDILSYLPTKEAVSTCVLSKRWKYLWTSVPSINFDDSLLYSSQFDFWHPLDVTRFMTFVERVLLLRDTSDVKRFRLSCRVCFSASRVNEWILAAIRRNVQELDLCLFVEEPFALPSCVFDNELLTVLRLEMNCTLQLPPRISFPCLRTLHLCLVTFPNDNLMQTLFSSCPFLEELAVLDCEWMNLRSISITMPSLKVLIIDDLPFCSVDDLRGCDIKIDAGNLIFFKYSGYLSNKINLYGLSSSALALIHIPNHCGRQREIACRTIKLFGGLRNVSSLRISSGTIESLFLVEHVMDRLPVFENLTLLELRGEFGEHSTKLLIKFLQCLPKLESLDFCEGLGRCEDSSRLTSVPNCVLSSLKTVNYRNLHGTNREIWFMKFLLENAIVLEKMNVFWSNSSSRDQISRKEINNQLHTLYRGSKNSALTVHMKPPCSL